MRFIPSLAHRVVDSVAGLILALSPWTFGFNYGGAETWVPLILGVLALVYSRLTDYGLGLLRAIPMPAHLGHYLAGGSL